jgi:predicted aspartyl protease
MDLIYYYSIGGVMKIILSILFFNFFFIFGNNPVFTSIDTHKVIEVPFSFEHNQVILQVKVNGKGFYNMLLDTGTDPSAIDLATAKEIGLKLDPVKRKGVGVGTGEAEVYLTKLQLIEVGEITAKDILAGAVDLSNVSQSIGIPLHGVLGYSFLKNRIVEFDYPKRILRFYPNSPITKIENETNRAIFSMLFAKGGNVPIIEGIKINGKKVRAIVDTGSSKSFIFTPAGTKYLGLEEIAGSGNKETGIGYRGKAEMRKGQIKKIIIGVISVDDPTVSFYSEGSGQDKELDIYGINIGNAFMQDYIMTFDYRNKMIVFDKQ